MRIDMTVTGAAGVPCDVAIDCAPGTRWAQVAALVGAAAGLTPLPALWAGTRRIGGDLIVGEPPLRPGAVLAPVADPDATGGLWRLEHVCGPGAGTVHLLDARSSTVGRDPRCDVTLPDPAVSRGHATFVRTGPRLRVIDCRSANGTHVNGVRTADRELETGDIVRIGDTVLRVSGVGSGDPCVDTVIPPVIEIPREPKRSAARAGRWVGMAVPLLLGSALAATMSDPRMLAFAAMSPLMLAVSVLFPATAGPRPERRRAVRRRRRAAAQALHEARADEARLRRAELPDPVTFRDGIAAGRPGRDGGVGEVRVGLGSLVSRVREQHGTELRDGTVTLVPVPVNAAGAVIDLRLPSRIARGLARWLVLQLSGRRAPPGVEIVLVVDDDTAAHWSWARWLPHPPTLLTDVPCPARGTDRPETSALPGAESVLRRIVVIDAGRARGSAGCDASSAVIRVGPPDATGDVVISPGASTFEVAVADRRNGSRHTAVVDVVSSAWAEDVCRLLLAAMTPGDGGHRPSGVPRTCRLLELIGAPGELAGTIRHRWAEARDTRVPMGRGADGVVLADLAADGPHALVAGTTGSGKSEFLQSWIASLAASLPPDQLSFVLVDFKGGAAFDCLRRLPHVCGVLTDLDLAAAQRAVESLHAEMKRRERLFARVGAPDLAAYRARAPAEPVPRLVVVVDEFAALADELPDLLRSLVALAQRGRSLGMHLVLATQRPSGVVSPDIRANVTLRIALRSSDPADSHEVIGSDAAFRIPAQSPGRAIMLSGGARTEFQIGSISQPAQLVTGPVVRRLGPWRRLPDAAPTRDGERDIDVLVAAIEHAAVATGRGRVPAPWCPPLPEWLGLADLAAEPHTAVFGLVDRPHLQDQVPLTADLRSGGSLIVTGGPGSGRTTALQAFATAAERAAPGRVELVAIDCAGGALAALNGATTVVVGESDPDRLAGCVEQLAERLRSRRRGAAQHQERDDTVVVCVIDGWEELVELSHQHDHGRSADLLLGILRSCHGTGVTVALAGGRNTLAPSVASAAATHLLLRTADPADLSAAGVPRQRRPSRWPPGRAFRTGDGAEIQLAWPGDQPMCG